MSHFTTQDEITIHYEIAGQGEPLIMIHGLNGNLSVFQEAVEDLQSRYQLITYDARGHGKSDRPENYTIDEQIEDLYELMKHLDLEQANILGHSMGAYVALGFATKHPKHLKKLILIGAKGHAVTSSVARLMIKHRSEIKGKSKNEIKALLQKYIYFAPDKLSSWLKRTLDYAEMTEEEEAVASRSISGFDYRAELPRIDQPVLLIVGLHDGLNPVEESEQIEQGVQQGDMYVYESSGHAPFIEERDRFARDVAGFLG